jgi:hypothetical protein
MQKPRVTRFCLYTLAAVLMLASTACPRPGSLPPTLAPATDYPTAVIEGLPTPTTAPTPTTPPDPVLIVAQGFGRDGRSLGYAFVVENPDPQLAVENSQYQVAVYDADGVVVETDSDYVELLLPGRRFGIAGTVFLDQGITVSKIEVQLSEGAHVASSQIPTFAIDSVTYHRGEYTSRATGVVKNPYDRDVTDLYVSAVAYDAAGEVIGGGFTYLNFILANGATGVKVNITSASDAEVASIELYAMLSALSSLTPEDSLPSGAASLVLAKHGFGQHENEVGFGMLVENPNASFAVDAAQYHLTVYAEDGSVLDAEQSFLDTLLPGQTLGAGGSLYLDEGMEVARLDVQIKGGRFIKSDAIPFFTTEQAVYQPDPYWPQVTGQIVSPYGSEITNLRVAAIAYDAAGEIIGGGYTFLDFVPANGKAAVEVSVTTAEEPTTVELYAAVSDLSEIEP